MTNPRRRTVPARQYYAYSWAMFTICKGCKAFKYCRGKSRERMLCARCAIGDTVDEN